MKLAIVNDSRTALEGLKRIVEGVEEITVIWTAADGREAVEKCREALPDMILMDIVMPVMDGVQATRQIMQETPCPILLVTASIGDNVSSVFEAMGAGAVDVVATPAIGVAEARRLLLEKIRNVATLSDVRPAKNNPAQERPTECRADACVLIGSSAGGPAVLMQILEKLPKDLPAAVVIVQHVDARFSSELASWLDSGSVLPVKVAAEGNDICKGSVLVAKGGQHLVFGKDRRLHYVDQPALFYQPSVDVFFESAAKYGPPRQIGIVLTGMGRDGAEGLKRLRRIGHPTIAQDRQTSAIYGMPRAAAENGAAAEILPAGQIAGRIASWAAKLQ